MDLEGRLAAARVDHLRGHMRKVTCLAWNKTGSTLASGSADGTVRLWHFEGAAQVRRARVDHASGGGGEWTWCAPWVWSAVRLGVGGVRGGRAHPLDEWGPTRAASADAINWIPAARTPSDAPRRRNAGGRGRTPTLPVCSPLERAAMPPPRERAHPRPHRARSPSPPTPRPPSRLPPQSRQPPTVLRYPPPTPAALPPGVDAVAWSPEDPTLLAVAGADRHVRFLDARTGKPEAAVQLKAGAVLFMAWHPDGSALAVGTSDDTLYFLSASRAAVDARRTGVLYAVQQSCEMNELAWTPSGLLFVSVGPKTQVETFEGAVSVLKPREGFTGAVEVARVRAHTGQIQALRFDPSFRLLATSSTDSTVALWSAEELAVVRTFDRLEFAAKSLSFSHDGALLATASDDKVVDVVRGGGGGGEGWEAGLEGG